jgi:hypothetical protein
LVLGLLVGSEAFGYLDMFSFQVLIDPISQ